MHTAGVVQKPGGCSEAMEEVPKHLSGRCSAPRQWGLPCASGAHLGRLPGGCWGQCGGSSARGGLHQELSDSQGRAHPGWCQVRPRRGRAANGASASVPPAGPRDAAARRDPPGPGRGLTPRSGAGSRNREWPRATPLPAALRLGRR